MHGISRIAHIEFLYSSALCKYITLYVCICASNSNEPSTYQDDTCGLENISAYIKNYKGTWQLSNNKHYP